MSSINTTYIPQFLACSLAIAIAACTAKNDPGYLLEGDWLLPSYYAAFGAGYDRASTFREDSVDVYPTLHGPHAYSIKADTLIFEDKNRLFNYFVLVGVLATVRILISR